MSLFITIICCLVIIVIGLYVCLQLIRTNKNLYDIYYKFESEIVKNKTEYKEIVGKGEIAASDYRLITYDRGKLSENRDKYNIVYADYVAVSQIISIFPLLGIFGTVLGLVLCAGQMNDENMMNYLGTALWTTLFGLVFSIVLKIADAYFLGKKVNWIDSEFEKAEAIIQHQTIAEEIRREIQTR